MTSKKMQYFFRGLMSPVLTPFNDDKERSLNLDVITKYAQFLSKQGINGVLVNGTSGEGMCMTVDERKKVTEEWRKACDVTKQSLMVQVGGAPLPDVIELAKHAESIKADSILCLPELFFKPRTVEDLVDYLQIISDAAPSTPLLYYHNPGFTGVNINMPEFLNEGMGSIKTLVGLKFTSINLEEGAACLAVRPEPVVFLGADKLIAGALQMGFDSVIGTSLNVLPAWSLNIVSNYNGAQRKMVLKYQQELTQAVDIITNKGSYAWVSAFKAAMNELTEVRVGPPRAPLKELTEEQSKQIKKEMVTAKSTQGLNQHNWYTSYSYLK